MKKGKFKFVLLLVILIGFLAPVSAQVYVKEVPASPVIVKTDPPGPDYIWIGDEWVVVDGAYVYKGGYWKSPPKKGYVWVPGHWKHNRRHGHVWIPGKWKKDKMALID